MTTDERIAATVRRIEADYLEILERPQMVCRGYSVESYVLAMELVLDLLQGENRRKKYRDFLKDRHFGMHYFQSKYEQENDLQGGIIDVAAAGPLADRTAEYILHFRNHWKEFIEWRSSVDRIRPTDR